MHENARRSVSVLAGILACGTAVYGATFGSVVASAWNPVRPSAEVEPREPIR